MEKLTWRTAGVTDTGLVRNENQDNFFISPDNRLFVVADGMGGAQGGAIASKVAVEAMRDSWTAKQPPGDDVETIKKWLAESITAANSRVNDAAQASRNCKNMGTTIVSAVQCTDGRMQIAHVGDSRAYLIRNGEAIVLTNDHSVVMEMFMRGQLSYEQCRVSPWRHLISRCLGHEEAVEIDYTHVELKPGDWILLASDGLSSVIDEKQLATLVGDHDDPEKVCKELLTNTLDGGAPDNVTIIATRYCGTFDATPKHNRTTANANGIE